jgi:hypothetical protein
MRSELPIDRTRLEAFCRRHHISRLALFGSALRADFGPDSDVDLLVKFEPGRTPGFFRLFDMEAELSQLFAGRRVDLRTLEDLSPYFRAEVSSVAEVLYDAA